MELEYSEKADTGVTGANIFFLPKLNPFLPIFFLSGREQQHIVLPKPVFFLPKHKQLFLTKTTEKICKNDKNRQKKCQTWQQASKNDRKTGKMLNSEMLDMFCVCSFKLSISFLPNYQFLFYQALHFFPAKRTNISRGEGSIVLPQLRL